MFCVKNMSLFTVTCTLITELNICPCTDRRTHSPSLRLHSFVLGHMGNSTPHAGNRTTSVQTSRKTSLYVILPADWFACVCEAYQRTCSRSFAGALGQCIMRRQHRRHGHFYTCLTITKDRSLAY